MPQAIEFWLLKLLYEVLKIHQDFISQNGSCLGSVKVHSLILPHTFSTPESMWCDSRASFWPEPLQLFCLDSRASSWPAPLQALCLSREPKAKVATYGKIIVKNATPNFTLLSRLLIITGRKTCIFDCSLRLNFSHKRHFTIKILLIA
jgi:hypothetical protein